MSVADIVQDFTGAHPEPAVGPFVYNEHHVQADKHTNSASSILFVDA